jgi:hypothetical protein
MQRYHYSTHFQFTAAHTLEFSICSSRILATDLSQSHCNFTSHMQPSFPSLIPFLPFLLDHLRLPSPELNSIPLLPSSISWPADVPKLNSSHHCSGHLLCPFISSRHGTQENSLYCWRGVFIVPLSSNRRPFSRARILRECVYRAVT